MWSKLKKTVCVKGYARNEVEWMGIAVPVNHRANGILRKQ